jgi:hypothetical protein
MMSFLLALLIAIQVHAGPPVTGGACPVGFLGDELATIKTQVPAEGIHDLDSGLEAIAQLESAVQNLRQKIARRGGAETAALYARLDAIEAKVNVLIDELGAITIGNKEAFANVENQLRTAGKELGAIDEALEAAAKKAATPVPRTKSQPGMPQQPASTPIANVTSFGEIKAGTVYEIPGGSGTTRQVIFSEEVVRDMNLKGVDPRAGDVVVQALKNGVVGERGSRGVKIMKTHGSTTFAEVKSIGGSTGEMRIFGCVDGARIILMFVGTDMKSSNDPQRNKLIKLCN